MPQIIKLPEGNTASFPDEMPREQIEQVLRNHYSSKSISNPVEASPSPLQRAADSPLVNKILAAGGGIQQGLSNTINQAIGRPLLPDAPTIAQEQMAANPLTASIGAGTGSVLPAVGVAGIGARSPLINAAVQGVTGAALAGPGNRIAGAIGGAILPVAVSSTLGSIGKWITSNAKQSKQITDLAKSLDVDPKTGVNIHKASDQAFSEFKNVPGAVQSLQSQTALNNTIGNIGNKITKQQLSLLEDVQQKVKTASNLEDLHEARKLFTRELGPAFLRGDDKVFGSTRQQLFTLRDTLEKELQLNAKSLGTLDKYNQANTLFKQSQEADIISKALKNTELPEGGNKWVNFNRTIQKLKKDDLGKLSPETKIALTGIQKTLSEANHVLGINVSKLGIFTPVINLMEAMFANPVTKSALIKLGSSEGRAASSAFAKGIINTLQAQNLAPIGTELLQNKE